ncbi:MAG: acetylserotonin O-methyltransferase [Acidobacteria bacterium]|nr:acetylserotonin O-methyltransferase [Acidobacteriota bacterium]
MTGPRSDDTKLIRAVDAMTGSFALLVAHDLKLFPVLSQGPLTLQQVAAALGIAERPAEALLCVVIAQGFVESSNGAYSLTPAAEDYLLPDSPTYYGGMLDLRLSTISLYSFESLKQAVLSNAPQAYGGGDAFESHATSASRAETFTRAMHSRSIAAALAWPRLLDLSRHHKMLDIAGGSGAHAIGATLAWPQLEAIVLDIAPVCSIAAEYAALQGLSGRIGTHIGDMWRDPLPTADLHFYSNIYHDWPPEKCRFLTRKSFDALPAGGRLIIHELLYDDDKRGPLEAAVYSMVMLLWTEGRQYSGAELAAMLAEAGFTEIEIKRSFGLWSVVTGVKA